MRIHIFGQHRFKSRDNLNRKQKQKKTIAILQSQALTSHFNSYVVGYYGTHSHVIIQIDRERKSKRYRSLFHCAHAICHTCIAYHIAQCGARTEKVNRLCVSGGSNSERTENHSQVNKTVVFLVCLKQTIGPTYSQFTSVFYRKWTWLHSCLNGERLLSTVSIEYTQSMPFVEKRLFKSWRRLNYTLSSSSFIIHCDCDSFIILIRTLHSSLSTLRQCTKPHRLLRRR